MTRIAVCLLTCDRAPYTSRTLASFAAWNPDQSRFVRLHADDASTDHQNAELVARHGFQTVVQNAERRGWLDTRQALFAAAQGYASWVLFLENDIESLRPFPWALFDFVARQPHIYCLRLYGRFKDQAKTEECLVTHKRFGHTPVDWRPLKGAPEASQIGRIHWSAQPAVTRVEPLRALHRTGIEPRGWTARVKKNVMAHIGVERTAAAPALPQEVAC